MTRTSNPRARSGRAAATASASEGCRPRMTSGFPASSTTVPRPMLPHGLARLVGGREARGRDHEQPGRVLLPEPHGRMSQPVELALQPVRRLAGGEGAALERVSLRGAGRAGAAPAGTALAGRSGGRGRGPLGRRRRSRRRRGRPGSPPPRAPGMRQAAPAWPGPAQAIHEQPRDDRGQHDHARRREGHMGVSRHQPAHRRPGMMFGTALGRSQDDCGSGRPPGTGSEPIPSSRRALGVLMALAAGLGVGIGLQFSGLRWPGSRPPRRPAPRRRPRSTSSGRSWASRSRCGPPW